MLSSSRRKKDAIDILPSTNLKSFIIIKHITSIIGHHCCCCSCSRGHLDWSFCLCPVRCFLPASSPHISVLAFLSVWRKWNTDSPTLAHFYLIRLELLSSHSRNLFQNTFLRSTNTSTIITDSVKSKSLASDATSLSIPMTVLCRCCRCCCWRR